MKEREEKVAQSWLFRRVDVTQEEVRPTPSPSCLLQQQQQQPLSSETWHRFKPQTKTMYVQDVQSGHCHRSTGD